MESELKLRLFFFLKLFQDTVRFQIYTESGAYLFTES